MRRTIPILLTAVAFMAACDQQPTEPIDTPNFGNHGPSIHGVPAGTHIQVRLTCFGAGLATNNGNQGARTLNVSFSNASRTAGIGVPNLSCGDFERRTVDAVVTLPVAVTHFRAIWQLEDFVSEANPQCGDFAFLRLDLPYMNTCTYLNNSQWTGIEACENNVRPITLCRHVGATLSFRVVGQPN